MINELTLYPSYFGAIGTGHSQIGSSISDPDVKSFLMRFTDRPGVIFPGTEMQPYYSGEYFKGFYFFSRTFSDKSGRPGMVFTHVLGVEIEAALKLKELSVIFRSFVTEVPLDKTKMVAEKTVLSIDDEVNLNERIPNCSRQVIQWILKGKQKIPVNGSSDDFRELIEVLWRGLPSEFRRSLRFRISFSPDDVPTAGTSIVLVQDEVSIGWKGYEVIKGSDRSLVELATEQEKLLAGFERNNEFRRFMDDLSAETLDFSSIFLAEKAFVIYGVINEVAVDEARQLIRLLSKLSPEPSKGVQIKSEAIQALISLTSKAGPQGIKALRNIELKAFSKGAQKVRQGIIDATSNSVSPPYSQTVVQEFLDLLTVFDSKNAVEATWWSDSIQEGIYEAFKRKPGETGKFIMKAFEDVDTGVTALEKILPNDSTIETAFILNFKERATNSQIEALLFLSKKRFWYDLHAEVLARKFGPCEAIPPQLEFESPLREPSDGLKRIIQTISNDAFERCVIELNDNKLCALFAVKCAQDPSLLKNLDVSVPAWLSVWAKTLQITKKFIHGLINPQEIAWSVLTSICNGQLIEAVVLDYMAQSPYSNLMGFPRRKEVWSLIGPNTDQYLESTANGIIETIRANKFDEEIEPPLHKKLISDDFMSRFLFLNSQSISIVVQVYSRISGLRDDYLAGFLKNFSSAMQEVEAIQLGRLVSQHNWTNSAYMIFEKAKSDKRFRVALSVCGHLIDDGDRFWNWKLFRDRVSEDKMFGGLLEVAKELYPKGPEEDSIWKRAGGDVTILKNLDSRDENWRTAIHHLRHGGGGRVTVKKLLKEMRSDYKSKKLDLLTEYFKILNGK